MLSKPSTLSLCLSLRDSLHSHHYDTIQNPNKEILIHGTYIIQKLLENRCIFVYPKLSFSCSVEGIWQSEELKKALSLVSGLNNASEIYLSVSDEILEQISIATEKAIKCIKPLLKSQKT